MIAGLPTEAARGVFTDFVRGPFYRPFENAAVDDRTQREFSERPESLDEAQQLIEDLVAKSQAEDGILNYRATTDLTEPNVVRFFNRYEDESTIEAHKETPHFQEFEEALPDLLAGQPEVIRFDVDSATELEQ